MTEERRWVYCKSCEWYRSFREPEPSWLIADKTIHEMDWPDHKGFVTK